jgi:tetratricopeptide (TPR) repeat protein
MTDSAHAMLMKTIYRVFVCLFGCSVFLIADTRLLAQSNVQLPSPAGYVNDFAGVIDAQTKSRLESQLQNLKEKTKIEFYVVAVDTTGGRDVFDFSHQLSTEWNIGARSSGTKSLLLVISVAAKTSFTQFSRQMQASLPDGVLGEMSQRMRLLLTAERFSEALDTGVQVFVSAVAQKLGIATQELEGSSSSPSAGNVAGSTSEPVPQTVDSSPSEPVLTRPRVVKETTKPSEKETTETAPNLFPTPTETPTPTTSLAATPVEKEPVTKRPRPEVKAPKSTITNRKITAAPVDDEADLEEVELTLTLPLAKRAEKLKAFLATHPESKARPRATELLISTHAGLGDQFLKSGDVDNGIKQLMLAIDEADVSISDKLFSGVIAQIPSNLYLRRQSEAAFKAASAIETKFGSDPKRLLEISGFYLGIERGDEAARIAEEAIKLAPESAEAHRVLALSRHINLQLDEAAVEYKRTIELDPTSRISKSSLADLTRASGKPEDALALYNELLKTDPNDTAATAGMVICLFELDRKEEATTALSTAVEKEPRNLALLSGAAYWLAAHGDYEKAFDFAKKAVAIEPRYTWAQIALVRSLIGLKRPLVAERAMRYARQFGKFPTLNYELANVVATMGFYDEAAEILRESFTFKEGHVETLLAGRIPARDTNFLDLLGVERRASIYQPTAADTVANSKTLTNLLALDSALTEASEGEKLDETAAAKAARDFGGGDDSMRTFRQLYAASRLVRKTIALQSALELVEEAKKGIDAALDVSVVTTAVQADEFRNLRAEAIASGNIPDIAEAPRSALSNIMRGRIDDLTGWILFNQDKYPEAIEHLKQATTTLPNGTPAWRNAVWHLGVAYEQTGRNDVALDSYIQSYNAGPRDSIRRSVIEKLYRKVNGSVEGLEDKIGPPLSTGTAGLSKKTAGTPAKSSAPISQSTPELAKSIEPEQTTPAPVARTETTKPEPTVAATPEPTPTALPTPTPTASEAPTPSQPEPISEEALRAAGARLRSNIRITGRVLDSNANGLSNVVVVLISPSGSVLASTTDKEGYYSFTVTPSQKTYRLIPSKDGYAFSPVDRAFAGLIDDQKGIDFIGRSP